MLTLPATLFKAALTLLLLVQGNPNIDATLRAQAVAVATQAIQVAHQAGAPDVSSITVSPAPGVSTTSVSQGLTGVTIGHYTMHVPTGFAVTPVSATITSVPVYSFTAGTENFFVALHPYVVSDAQKSGTCTVAASGSGVFPSAVYCEGNTMTSSFQTKDWRVFYGINYSDRTMDCTTLSGCANPPAAERYGKTYIFVVPDVQHNMLVEFYAPTASYGASQNSDGFEGVAATIRTTVLPSLTR
jgi:hypothetical protein